MRKRIIRFIIAVLVLFFISKNLHQYFLSNANKSLSYSLSFVYGFYAVASVIIYSIQEVVFKKLPSQIGYSFLMAVFIKIGCFMLIFQDILFHGKELQFYERLPFVTSLFIFLFLEVYALFLLLKTNQNEA